MGYMAWGTKNSSVKAHSHNVVSKFFNRLDVEIGMHFLKMLQMVAKLIEINIVLVTLLHIKLPNLERISLKTVLLYLAVL